MHVARAQLRDERRGHLGHPRVRVRHELDQVRHGARVAHGGLRLLDARAREGLDALEHSDGHLDVARRGCGKHRCERRGRAGIE